MKNLFAYDFTTNTIVASKATLKKAGNPTTPEYKALMKMIAEQPTCKVVEKTINTKSGKTTYKGLTIQDYQTVVCGFPRYADCQAYAPHTDALHQQERRKERL